MAKRSLSIKRTPLTHDVDVTIDHVTHQLTERNFVALMEQGLALLRIIEEEHDAQRQQLRSWGVGQ